MKPSVVCIGTFDGVHLGHRKIIGLAVRRARQIGAEPAVLTFSLPPRLYFAPVKGPYLLNTLDEKMLMFRLAGIQKAVVLEFGKEIAGMTAQEFFRHFLLNTLKAKVVVAGYNFRFGKDRGGDAEMLRAMGKDAGVKVKIAAPLMRGGRPVSSGRIRESLHEGKLHEANRLLGSPYFLLGKVRKERKIGTQLGFPTANISVPQLKIVPRGVYACTVKITGHPQSRHPAVCNIGYRPTLGRVKEGLAVETHLLDYSGNLYDKEIKVELLEKLRAERKFSGVEALRRQITQDVSDARRYFKHATILRRSEKMI